MQLIMRIIIWDLTILTLIPTLKEPITIYLNNLSAISPKSNNKKWTILTILITPCQVIDCSITIKLPNKDWVKRVSRMIIPNYKKKNLIYNSLILKKELYLRNKKLVLKTSKSLMRQMLKPASKLWILIKAN